MQAGIAEFGDLLSGDAGNDIVVGTARADIASGGAGEDTLVAGAGDDLILGDGQLFETSPVWGNQAEQHGQSWNSVVITSWTFEVVPDASGGYVAYHPGFTRTEDPTQFGRDLIHAGNGNDAVSAGGGDDLVYGEAGDDLIVDRMGNDTFLGGEGNDRLIGGNRDEDAEGRDFLDGRTGDDEVIGAGGFVLLPLMEQISESGRAR